MYIFSTLFNIIVKGGEVEKCILKLKEEHR